MRIAFIDIFGLSYDGNTLQKRGLGGSESAIIFMARELAALGHEVFVYNDCTNKEEDVFEGTYDGVKYFHKNQLRNHVEEIFDIVVSSRSVIPLCPKDKRHEIDEKSPYKDTDMFDHIQKTTKHKVLWMHDTFCQGDNLIEYLTNMGYINEVFTLSDWHTSYVTTCAHGPKRDFAVLKKKIWETRNGINVIPRDWIDIKKKDPNHFVYNASATKGMVPLVTKIWPRFKANNQAARLTIVGGYYQFRDGHIDDQQKTVNEFISNNDSSKTGITFTGVIRQDEISDILTNATYFLYPSAFPETYGISTLEALAHNLAVITCERAALEEVAIDIASYKIPYAIEPDYANWQWLNGEDQENRFLDLMQYAYDNKYLTQQKMYAGNQVRDVCTWRSVAKQWNQHFHKILNEPLNIHEYRETQKINQKVIKTFGRRFQNAESYMYPKAGYEKNIHIIIPVYNAEKYISKCIRSIAAQDYYRYRMIIIDDASTDNTVKVIRSTLQELGVEDKAILHFNKERNGSALANQWMAISELSLGKPGADIIMLVDGDDWLPSDPHIFSRYNDIMDWNQVSYGSMWSEVDQIPLIAQDYPMNVIEQKAFRSYTFNWNIPYTHLRVFTRELASRIEPDNLKDENGNFYGPGGDGALMYELLEKADPLRIYANPEIVYCYNDTNPINDYKVNSKEQDKNAKAILKMNQFEAIEEEMTDAGKYSTPNLTATVPSVTTGKHEVLTVSATPPVKKKILCAVPTANYIEAQTFKSIFDQIVPDGYEMDFQSFFGYRVDQVRNLIADWAIRGYDYLFAVDHDVTFEPDTLKKMLAHDKDLVTGIYRARLENKYHLEIYDMNQIRIPLEEVPNDLFQVGGCGFGCVLVKSKVFEEVGYPQFEYHPALDHRNTFSEDNDFCKKVTDKGITMWCDPTIRCGHLGQKNFDIPKPLDEMFKPSSPAEFLKEEIGLIDNTQERFRELRFRVQIPDDHMNALRKMGESGINPEIIYDLGACVLHWYDAAKLVWPESKIIPFEAMAEVAEFYEREGLVDFCAGVLLSDKTGEQVEWHENLYHPGGNSKYVESRDLSPLAEELFPEENTKIRSTVSLDDLIDYTGYPLPDLIKMDIQGSELDVLKGATKCLENAKYLILELQHVDFNLGAPKKDEVIAWLAERGWDLMERFGGSDLSVDHDYLFIKSA